MVKKHRKDSKKRLTGKHFNQGSGRASKINASTAYGTCSEQISPFGGLLGLTKVLDLFDFEKHFNEGYHAPSRETQLGDYAMVMGLVMLMFIGFNRIWHFVYLRLEPMLCGIFSVDKLPASSTYWRYLDSLGINQAQSLLRIMSRLREQAWKRCGIQYSYIAIDIDTTVETIYGDQEGGRVGHNPKHRGKKGYRPILCFIEQTREYLYGKLRKGETVSGEETAKVIRIIKDHLPSCVQKVLLRADAEFMSWNSVDAALDEGYDFIFSNKQCEPPWRIVHEILLRDYKNAECVQDSGFNFLPGSAKSFPSAFPFSLFLTPFRKLVFQDMNMELFLDPNSDELVKSNPNRHPGESRGP